MKLKHGRVEIALHALQAGSEAEDSFAPLLLLHALGSSARAWPSEWIAAWPGEVYALDFAGHGDSERIAGGGYNPEYFLADADLALEAIEGGVVVAGAGIGGYVALLLAGARPDEVAAALILPGSGLAGGGSEPDQARVRHASLDELEALYGDAARRYGPGCDPMVSLCEIDLRPTDYVAQFADAARCLLYSTSVAEGDDPPSWWGALVGAASSGPAAGDLALAIGELAAACRESGRGE